MSVFNLRSKFSKTLKFFLFDILYEEDTCCEDGEIALKYSISSSARRFLDSSLLPSLLFWSRRGVLFVSFFCPEIETLNPRMRFNAYKP